MRLKVQRKFGVKLVTSLNFVCPCLFDRIRIEKMLLFDRSRIVKKLFLADRSRAWKKLFCSIGVE